MADELLSGSEGTSGSLPTVKITVRPNGPFRVEGPFQLVDVEGKEWDIAGRAIVSLCRCGLSTKRPFCDGTHGKEGWKCDASPVPVEPVAQG
ncbi:CDGSH iron-sulfur domain-containing protein [Granulicella tundricola]|uniref:Iron sulfur-containing domain, CDGSH-type n=1 Tax=Granulicella tundricola (strain ATCC BAA-1859 / DSM 23138 / MP5ACTX9) TaxID=1198114 RepID=E8X5G9_GRATM|nr:CDGSH iron-sulfur domain-containing protein [Granulicella tundricola]ADW69516.1 Iron sulfur-containing domain, CDGSH-type [Granulicella tundricola MP5ACTX9]